MNAPKGLLTLEQRENRRANNLNATLNFLAIETFSSVEVFQQLLEFETRTGTIKALRVIRDLGHIKEYDCDTLAGRKIKLFGITSKGIHAIVSPDELPERVRIFEPSRISLLTLPHRLKTHAVMVEAIRNNYQVLNVKNEFKGYKKWPDILIFNPESNRKTSIEIELTIKSKKRYKKVLEDYAEPFEYGAINTVIWLTESPGNKEKLEHIFAEYQTTQNHQFLTIPEFIKSIQR